jgi:hypothetical protein
MIKLLKDQSLYTKEKMTCGTEYCCVWHEIGHKEELLAGEEIDEIFSYFCDDLVEGEDYEYIS